MRTKREIARILSEIAFYLRLRGDNPYKSAAYERAARALLLSPHEPYQLVESDTLTDIQDIGPGTAAVIRELLLTGRSSLYQRVKGSYPTSLVELGQVPGLDQNKFVASMKKQESDRSLTSKSPAAIIDLCPSKGLVPKYRRRLKRH